MTISEIKKKYIRIDRPCDDLILITLVVGWQSFHFAYKPSNIKSAKWYQNQLAKALKRIIEEGKA
jgi:fatty-acid desaturase